MKNNTVAFLPSAHTPNKPVMVVGAGTGTAMKRSMVGSLPDLVIIDECPVEVMHPTEYVVSGYRNVGSIGDVCLGPKDVRVWTDSDNETSRGASLSGTEKKRRKKAKKAAKKQRKINRGKR